MRLRRIAFFIWAIASVGIVVVATNSEGVARAATATPAASAPTSDPIKHVVVILEENHSFDNVLGKFCTEVANGHIKRPGKDRHCDGAIQGQTNTGQVVNLSPATDYVPFADHSVVGQQRDIASGAMNGFSLDPNCSSNLSNCYTQYDPLAGPCTTGSCIPNYSALAARYTVSDRTFESYASPSWAGHLVWATSNQDGFYGTNPITSASGPQPLATGSGWGCDSGRVTPWGPSKVLVPSCIPDTSGSLGPNWANYTGPKASYAPTIFDELAAKGLSWKIYGGAGAPSTSTSPYSAQGWQWAICPTFVECLYTPQRNNLVSTSQLTTDAAAGQLPSYSVVTPTSANSQHNNNNMCAGDNFIGATVSAIQASPEWTSTAIFITYDDCGCFYDHVNPLQYSSTWGIRVPMVIVSPYVKKGYTDSVGTTFAGTLSYVEHVFGLPALNSSDAHAYDYRGAFCYQSHLTGCVPAGTQVVPMATQAPTALTGSQKTSQIQAGSDDT
jgi:phospholipase C